MIGNSDVGRIVGMSADRHHYGKTPGDNMRAFLRVKSHEDLRVPESGTDNPVAAPAGSKARNSYLDALTKLVPSEVIAAYLAGKGVITAYLSGGHAGEDAKPYWITWTLLCLIGVIIYRRWATSDAAAHVPPEWPAVAISSVSLLVWIYSFGDVFTLLGLWHPLVATVLVIAWTFLTPVMYRSKN